MSNDNGMTQTEAEKIAQKHIELASRVVAWFGFDRRDEVTWGPQYNQSARDLYERACALMSVTPHPAE